MLQWPESALGDSIEHLHRIWSFVLGAYGNSEFQNQMDRTHENTLEKNKDPVSLSWILMENNAIKNYYKKNSSYLQNISTIAIV